MRSSISSGVRWNSVIFVQKTGIRMFFKRKKEPAIDPEQHELLEHAQRRIRQKRRLFQHFVIFLIGCVFLIALNKILKYGEPHNWYLWAITIWAFLFVVHLAQVFITDPFLGRDWERSQREKLLKKQQKRISQLEAEIARTHPLPEVPEEPEPPKELEE
jgi:hypothetical protein